MFKHLLYLFPILGILNLQAQERYVDKVFEEVTVHSDVIYSDSTGYYMDIYEPAGDTMAQRPLLIFAHGGAFIDGSPRTSTSVDFCTQFAQRGYVTASIQYKLADYPALLVDSLAMFDVVVKAMGDAKAAIRYFNKDAVTNKTYRTDPDRVFIGGNSAGGILSMHMAYLDENDILPEKLNEVYEANGGFEGERGNPGYPSDVIGVINLAGGLNVLSLVDGNSPETFSAHGDIDSVVPFDCNDVYWADPIIGVLDMTDICGSSVIHPILDELGIRNELIVYENADHTPWSFNASMRDDIIQMAADFLAPLTVPIITSNENDLNNIDWKLYPNPSNGLLTLEHDLQDPFSINIYETTGRLVKQQDFSAFNQKTSINCSDLRAGAYILELYSNDSKVSELFFITH